MKFFSIFELTFPKIFRRVFEDISTKSDAIFNCFIICVLLLAVRPPSSVRRSVRRGLQMILGQQIIPDRK